MENSNYKITIEVFQKNNIFDNESIGNGVYIAELLVCGKTIPLYIGESVFMLRRCGEHLYELLKEPEYWGLTKGDLNDPDLKLIFRVLQPLDDKLDNHDREIYYIETKQPKTQNATNDRLRRNRKDIVQAEIAKAKGI